MLPLARRVGRCSTALRVPPRSWEVLLSAESGWLRRWSRHAPYVSSARSQSRSSNSPAKCYLCKWRCPWTRTQANVVEAPVLLEAAHRGASGTSASSCAAWGADRPEKLEHVLGPPGSAGADTDGAWLTSRAEETTDKDLPDWMKWDLQVVDDGLDASPFFLRSFPH